MKNFFRGVLFFICFIVTYIVLSYLFLPKQNLKKYGMYNTSLYEILGENKNTIDTIVIGDSLVYSSVSPMNIYDKYGFTVFDCSKAAMILPDAYDYFKVAVESQQPKIVILEPSMFFRNSNKAPWYDKHMKTIKNSLPLVTYHNNWKKILFKNNKVNSWTNVSKGYKKNIDIKASHNYDYMKFTKRQYTIPDENHEYIKKIIDYCDEQGIRLLLVGLPSQKSWNYAKHKIIEELSEKYNLSYINFNFDNIIKIDWEKETKDYGGHLNYFGAQKVSEYLGYYLKNLNLLTNHKKEKGFEEWDRAVNFFLNN